MYVRDQDKCVCTACAYHPWSPSKNQNKIQNKNKIAASNKRMAVTLMGASVLTIYDAGTCESPHTNMCITSHEPHVSFICAQALIHMRAMTPPYMRHDSLICVA